MGTGRKVLSWMGGKVVQGAKAGAGAINTELKKSMDESKRKKAIYKEEYDNTFRLEQEKTIREKAREDARKRARGKK